MGGAAATGALAVSQPHPSLVVLDQKQWLVVVVYDIRVWGGLVTQQAHQYKGDPL